MTKKRFWNIIAASRAGYDPEDYETSRDEQLARLTELLEGVSVGEVQEFDAHFSARMDEAYSQPKKGLWAVAFDIGGGCSEDGFDDFRSWLISMGGRAFDTAVRDPESVYRLSKQAGVEDDVFFEEFGYVSSQVLEKKTGEDE